MNCPFCRHADTRVVDSRLGKEGNNVRRRRECPECERRFTTYERVEEILPWVIKKDGRREAFDRPVSVEQVEALVDQLERKFQECGDKEISASLIGEAVMDMLQDVDEVAYVRFASVYRQFKDINEFMSELNDLLKNSH